MLGASYDTIAANRAFAEKFQWPFKLLCDVDHAVGEAYGVDDPADPGYPRRASYLIGPDQRIVNVYDVTDAATHATDVLADLPPRP